MQMTTEYKPETHRINIYFIPFTSRPNMPLLHTSTVNILIRWFIHMCDWFVSDFIQNCFALQLIFLGGFKISSATRCDDKIIFKL